MQTERRSRLASIAKKVAVAFAVKKGIDMFQESRRPRKRSLVGRLAKLGLWTAGAGGVFYAFLSGKLQPLVDKVMGASSTSSSDYSSSWSPSGSTSTTGFSSGNTSGTSMSTAGSPSTAGSSGKSEGSDTSAST